MKLTESLFNIDFKDVIREVANDVRDDWYPDPLYYEDQYKEPGIVERVNNVISSGGQLSSIYCDRYDFPKDDKHVRPAMYLDGVSRLLYHSSVRFVYNYYESNVPAIVFSGRIDRSDKLYCFS